MKFLTTRSLLSNAAIGVALCCLPTPVPAHHSIALYETGVPMTITGVVRRFEWTNPHALLYLDVRDAEGKVERWTIEMMSPNSLKSYGWARDLVKPGDVISCTGGRAKNGLPAMLVTFVKLADGRKIRC